MALGFDALNIVKSGSDNGDQCQRHGMYWFAVWFYDIYLWPYMAVMKVTDYKKFYNGLLILSPYGPRFVRSWLTGWVSDRDRLSRDQYSSILVAMGAHMMRRDLKPYFLEHLRRGLMFAWNTRRNGATASNHGEPYRDAKPLSRLDRFIIKHKIPFFSVEPGYHNYNWKLPDFTGPEVWALYIRAFEIKLLWPILFLFDIETAIGAYLNRKSDSPDVLNHTMICIFAAEIMPTPMIALANKINSAAQINEKLERYFDKETEFPMHKIYKEMVFRVIR